MTDDETAANDRDTAHPGVTDLTSQSFTLRNRHVTAALTVLAVVGIGLGAATFDVRPPTIRQPNEPAGYDGVFDPEAVAVHCPAILSEWWLLFGFLAAVGSFVIGAKLRGRSALDPRVVLPTLVVIPVYIGWVVVCEPYPEFGIRFGGVGGSIGLYVPLGLEQVLLSIFVFGLVLHALAGGWFWHLVSGRRGRSSPPEPIERDGSELEWIGDVAGEIADRFERREHTENLVFLAWREMTALVNIPNPETSTPREFADAAIATGLAPDDVEALTRLFEDVRYGDRMGPDDEERAISVLRRIEASYSTERGNR